MTKAKIHTMTISSQQCTREFREKVKLSFFTGEIIVYLENPKDYIISHNTIVRYMEILWDWYWLFLNVWKTSLGQSVTGVFFGENVFSMDSIFKNRYKAIQNFYFLLFKFWLFGGKFFHFIRVFKFIDKKLFIMPYYLNICGICINVSLFIPDLGHCFLSLFLAQSC